MTDLISGFCYIGKSDNTVSTGPDNDTEITPILEQRTLTHGGGYVADKGTEGSTRSH